MSDDDFNQGEWARWEQSRATPSRAEPMTMSDWCEREAERIEDELRSILARHAFPAMVTPPHGAPERALWEYVGYLQEIIRVLRIPPGRACARRQ